MTVSGQLLQMLQSVAEALGSELRDRLVFVGGCTTALFITDPVTLEDVRATDDVDLIVDLAGYGESANLQAELRERGFAESQDDAVICRMRLGAPRSTSCRTTPPSSASATAGMQKASKQR